MEKSEFEIAVQETFDGLPTEIVNAIENVHIVVEDSPGAETCRRLHLASPSMLLGLYEGIPLNKRGTNYGDSGVLPDKVTLYQKNIEAVAATPKALREKIREVLVHELGHYYGMNEQQVRDAGY